jgi:TonB family protein
VGGDEAMMKYLKENIVFPKDAEDKGLEGTVFVDFIVLEDGSVLEVSVEDAPGEEVDQSFRDEAIRVVNSMPKWTPGHQGGKPVDVKFSLPITFQIM